MARAPKPIAKKAAEAWERGDEPLAEKLSGLKSRQLRNRLGPPGRAGGPVASPATPVAHIPAPSPGKPAMAPPRATAATCGAPGPDGLVCTMPPHAAGTDHVGHGRIWGDAPPSEPTLEQIGQIDTEDEAEALYRDVRARMVGADAVRYASLVEKALAALRQIAKLRGAPRPAPDEVTARLVAVRDRSIRRFGILARESVARGAGG